MKKILLILCALAMFCSCTKEEAIQESIRITRCSLSSPNSVGGCDLDVTFKNVSNKSIDYISFNFDFYNALGDEVPCEIRGYSFFSRVPGKFLPQTAYDVHWDCPIYNKNARAAKIDYIYIEYSDGTNLTIKDKQLSLIGYR